MLRKITKTQNPELQ